jgi:anti-sigma B factor antagonist
MKITTEGIGQVQLVTLDGRMDALTSIEVEKTLGAIMEAGYAKLVLDLGRVEYVNSSGLRVLMGAFKECRSNPEGDLRLAGIQPMVEQVMQITGFYKIFAIYTSADEAVASYTS